MLTWYVDRGCSLWPHPRRGGWRIKAGAGIIKWGWRWRGGLTLPQCQPSIIIKIRPRTFISCIAAEKIHYNVIIIQIMCASLPTFCCRNTTENQNLKVNICWSVDQHMPGERKKCYERIGNSCTSTRQYVWSSNESHVWLQIYLSTKAIVFFPILNNL